MIFIFLAIMLGLALGIFSFYQLELFLAATVILAAVGGLFLRLLTLFNATVASSISPTGQSQGWFKDYVNMLKAFFDLLPESAQTAVFLLPVFVIIGRVLTWAHYTAFADQALPLTEAEKRAATMTKFSFKSPKR